MVGVAQHLTAHTSAVQIALSGARVRKRRLPLHALVGGSLVALVVLAALLSPVLAPERPETMRASLRLLPPGPGGIFGTDPFGRDLFSQVIYGARLALQVSLLSVLLSAAPGIGLGLLAGYRA